jgi:exonuclease VII large subunit
MPVTAKLSRRFYEQFGDDLTNELVEWFNSVDATYQSDLRELNENNFARSDAKLEQRTAGIEARIDGVEARLEAKIDGVATRLEAKINGVETRLEAKINGVKERLEAKINGVEERLEAKINGVEERLEAKINGVETRLNATMERRFAEQGERFAVFESRITRWMFALWTGTMVTIAGLAIAVLRTK